MKFIELNGLKLYLSSSVSIDKGKKPGDYSSNWSALKNGGGLAGKEYRFSVGTPEHSQIRQLVKDKYGAIASPAANADIKLIDEERANDYLATPTPNCKVTGIKNGKQSMSLTNLPIDNPLIDSFTLATQLGIQHKNLLATIRKYQVDLENNPVTKEFEGLAFKTHINKGGRNSVYCLLNFRQALTVGALSQNSEEVVRFKFWLTAWFNVFVTKGFQDKFPWLPSNAEGLLQTQLALLSSYTSTPLRQEVSTGLGEYRVDLLMGNSIAIELRTRLISPSHLKTLLFEKNYYHSLKTSFPNLETLILCSTIGINKEAKEIIEHFNPYIIYESVSQVASRFFSQITPGRLGDRFQDLLSYTK
jgi:hypothetical protein